MKEKERKTISSSQLIEEHLFLVDMLAGRLIQRLSKNIELDELKSAGILGLIDAAEKFDTEKGQSFKTYAQIRIQGSMIDELRSQDCLPRSMRQKYNQYIKQVKALSLTLGRQPNSIELAQAMNISVAECERISQYQHLSNMYSLDDVISQSDQRTLSDKIADPNILLLDEVDENAENLKRLEQCIPMLNEKQRTILNYYYFDQLKLREIAEIFDVTESRISQILSQATAQLKVYMERIKNEK
jgi:RNA polymerase sigma factor for flagellar operon FliA